MAVPDFPSVLYAIPGGARDDGCTIAIGIPQDGSHQFAMFLGVSESSTASDGFPSKGISFTQLPPAKDSNGMVLHAVRGLKPGTVYHAGISKNRSDSNPDWIGDPIRFRTLHNATSSYPIEVKYAYGSCQIFHADPDGPKDPHHGGPLQVSWQDLRAFLPDILFDTGDFHYQGANPDEKYGPDASATTWAKMYWSRSAASPRCARRARW